MICEPLCRGMPEIPISGKSKSDLGLTCVAICFIVAGLILAFTGYLLANTAGTNSSIAYSFGIALEISAIAPWLFGIYLLNR